jgi:hypothetical protein
MNPVEGEVPNPRFWVRRHHTIEISHKILRIDEGARALLGYCLHCTDLAVKRRQGQIVVPVMPLHYEGRNPVPVLRVGFTIRDKRRRAPDFRITVRGGRESAINDADDR